MNRRPTAAGTIVCALASTACAQSLAEQPPAEIPATEPLLAPVPTWEFSISATLVSVKDDHTYLQPTFTADYDWLHLEARYNYEEQNTASLWAGCNLSGGKDLTFTLTPMLGVVFGDVNGVAPSYELTLNWWKLEFYTEGEYVFSTESKDENFFYSWSQLTLTPVEHVYVGVAFQRTRAYHSDREIDAGPLIGCSFAHVDLSAWLLNPGDDHQIFGLSAEFTF